MIRTPGSARASANVLAMVFLDSQSTNYDPRNELRFAHHVQHPVQKKDDQFRTGAWGSTVGRPNV